jgi:transcriptional regulator with GAF, ATPase, and Fis domain
MWAPTAYIVLLVEISAAQAVSRLWEGDVVAERSGSGDTSERGMPSEQDEGSTDENELAEQLGELARSLQSYRDTDELLTEVVQAAVRMIPGVDEASISVVQDRQAVSSRLPTGELPVRVDALQEATGQGPCLDAMYEQRTVRVSDMANDDRWPEFAAQAARAGAASMLSIQLWVEGDNLGALNLYGRRVDAFDDESEQVGLLFASHAAVAFAAAQGMNHMREAVDTRDLIGQAKGILMERYKVTGDQAFRMLVKVSNDNNRTLRSVAQDLASTGVLIERRPRRGPRT